MTKKRQSDKDNLTKDERLDLIVDKIKKGVHYSFRHFLKAAIKNNKKLITKRNGKVALIPASEFKSR